MAAAMSETPDDHFLTVLTSEADVTHYRVQREGGVYVLDGAFAGDTTNLEGLVEYLRAQGSPPLTAGCLGLKVRQRVTHGLTCTHPTFHKQNRA